MILNPLSMTMTLCSGRNLILRVLHPLTSRCSPLPQPPRKELALHLLFPCPPALKIWSWLFSASMVSFNAFASLDLLPASFWCCLSSFLNPVSKLKISAVMMTLLFATWKQRNSAIYLPRFQAVNFEGKILAMVTFLEDACRHFSHGVRFIISLLPLPLISFLIASIKVV